MNSVIVKYSASDQTLRRLSGVINTLEFQQIRAAIRNAISPCYNHCYRSDEAREHAEWREADSEIGNQTVNLLNAG